MAKSPTPRPVSIDFEGKQYEGTYTAESGAVTVIWYSGTDGKRNEMSTHAIDAEREAGRLLREMVEAAKERGEL